MPATVPSFLAAQLIRVLPRRTIGRFVGDLCEARLHPTVSRAVVKAYCKAYRVDLSEVEHRDDPYESFDRFFTRCLRCGCRESTAPADDVVSPADGKVQSIGPVEAGARIVVKGRPYDLAKLIGDERDARAYVGGQYAVVYLSPRDYHRVHAPVDGAVALVRSLPGDYYPVNSVGERWVRNLLVANRRVAIVQQNPVLGPVTTVLVAAMVVGRITTTMVAGRDVPLGTHAVEPPYAVRRGDELGAFHLGSTAVVITGPHASAWQRAPGLIRVGESLVRSAG